MYDAVERNIRGTWLLFAVFVLVVVALGYAFGQLLDLGYVSGAREAPRDQHPYLYNAVEGLAIAAGIPAPRVYLINDTAPNAFATGRDPQHAAVVVTTGLLEKLDRLELEGVLAHELSHVKNYDVRLATVASVLVGMVILLSDMFQRSMFWGRRRGSREGRGGSGLVVLVGLALAVLAPLFAQLLRLAISRNREYLADASAAMLTRYPEGLASALEKISADPEPLEAANKATAHMYIINPLREWGGYVNSLFNTHPPVEERVRRLRER
jgi:heat shock protein HtpX